MKVANVGPFSQVDNTWVMEFVIVAMGHFVRMNIKICYRILLPCTCIMLGIKLLINT